MTTHYDPEAGTLRLGHAALSVLARLAVSPTDPSLTDHATAPPLSALRRAGIIGPGGIDPAVRPLAEVLGAPQASLALGLDDGVSTRRCRGWATSRLLVLGVPAETEQEVYDLMADVPAEAGGLIGELVGLAPAPPTAADPVALSGEAFADLLAGTAVDALGTAVGQPPVRWQLEVRGAADGRLEVLDAGAAGLWRVEAGDGDAVVLHPVDAAAVRARIDALVTAALG